jgi:hypothetical protein
MAWLDNLENEDLRFNSRSWLTLTKEPFEAFLHLQQPEPVNVGERADGNLFGICF